MPAIRDNATLSRFELESDGILVIAHYRLSGTVMTIDHTETPVEAQGRGLASQLIKGVLDEARARGLKVAPRCPFVSAYIARHPHYADLLA
jgi:hypothetical protein